MNTSAIRRFLTALSSTAKLERGQLYQLIQSAEASYCLRDIESQREIGLLLQSFGYPFNQVGKYYESIYLYRRGEYQKATELLENVADSAPAQYRSKALLSLSAVEERIGHFEESLRLRFRLQTSLRDDPVVALETQQGIAVLRSLEGDHGTALRELERLIPLAHIIGKRGHPAYITFLNSYAVVLSETGRNEQAEQVANVIAASPFISKYPEWQDTVSEIASRRKRSSTIAVTTPKDEPRRIRDSRIQTAIEFMETNFQRKISLSDMADAAHLSKSHFSRVFNAQTGCTPGDYLIRLRVENARELLMRGSLSVKEVMTLAGFNAKSNFTRSFKKHFDVAPSEYRRRAREREESK